eukprot:COSAG02_NODE_7290_length_3083_cov_1.681300_3_plen_91_part_00
MQSEQLSIVYAGATIIVRAISIPRSFSSSDLAPPPAGVAPRAAARARAAFPKKPIAGTRARVVARGRVAAHSSYFDPALDSVQPGYCTDL